MRTSRDQPTRAGSRDQPTYAHSRDRTDRYRRELKRRDESRAEKQSQGAPSRQ
jgi:hypothetical protein